MNHATINRLLALFLAVVMVIGYIPTYAFATEDEASQETTAAFVEETEAATEAAETEAAEVDETQEETTVATEEATEAPAQEPTEEATEEATEAPAEEATEEATQPEEEYNFPDVDSMTDAELLAYYAGLSDEEAEAFALSLTEKQLKRLSDLLYGVELCSESSETHTVFKDTQSTLAPGVTQNLKFAYSSDGKQMAYYIATADVTRDDVVVQTSYYKQHEDGVMGMAKLTEQIAYANDKYTDPEDEQYISDYYNVVAGVNASFYNMQTGQPTGITFIDGVSFGTNSYDNFFAILKDGKTAVIDYASNLSKYVDENGNSTIWQAVAGSQWLVRDGKDVTANISGSYNTDRHSRTCVGVTADGKVVLMVLDGRQEPFSCGGSMHELAQIMLEAGCVAAVNLDGGGSTTFASKAEGANSVEVINRPSDGSERSISAGIIIATTTVPSDVFDHVSMVATDEYVTPGTGTEITVAGVSPAGTTAAIPEGMTYTVTNGTYEDGILTAAEAGDVVLTAQYNGVDVGSVTIHCVIPEAIEFSASSITVPYGKSLDLEMTATYGLNEVKTKAEDFQLTLSDEAAGTLEGLTFTACEEDAGVESSQITAVFTGVEDLTATATIVMGKGSEALWDFEDGDVSGWVRQNKASYNYILTPGSVSLSSAANGGIVHSGDYALKFNMDFSVSTEGGYMSGLLGLNNDEVIDLGGATSFGMWIYVPIEAKSLNGRIYLRQVTARNEDGSIKTYNTTTNSTDATMDGDGNWNVGFVTQFEESGWHYISFDLTTNGELGYCIPPNATLLDIYINDRDNTEYNYNHLDYSSLNQNVVMYVDDVTLDYSSVVDDREFPIFSGVTYADTSMSDAAILKQNATISGGTISFAANVSEDTSKDNATGLDETTAKAYIDGKAVSCTFDGNKISVADVSLLNGSHTVKFSICDKQGNYASIIRTFTVNASGNNGVTVKLEPHDATLDKILLGSVYYVDVVATHVEATSSVVVDLDLNNISVWELAHMEVAEGFKASYSIIDADENIARVTITRTKATDATGEMALVSMPIRTWELPCVVADYGSYKGQHMTYELFKKGSETWPIDIQVTVIAGVINGSTTFAGDTVQVDTESYVWDNATKPAEYATWNGGHDHRDWTKDYYSASSTNHVDAIALEDKAATCTESGYTGRTYCEVCDSVVEWGTTIPATGHTYEMVDGVVKCHCGETFTGTWTDGKEYTDGVAQADGWVDSSYYVDGTKLTGVHKVADPDGSGEYYYDFGEDGISTGKYTGLLFDQTMNCYCYAKLGTLAGGWYMIDEDWYHFDEETFAATTGTRTDFFEGVTYVFEETGKLTTGVWVKNNRGYRYFYGPDYYRGGGNTASTSWIVIEGKTYCIDDAGYRYEGLHYVIESNSTIAQWYDFGTDGVLIGKLTQTGGLTVNGKLYYLVEGVSRYGLALIDGDYYYMSTKDYAAVTGSIYAAFPNGLLPQANYTFGEDGKMTSTFQLRTDDDGEIRFYVDGTAIYAGLVKDTDGAIYYINSSLCAIRNKSYTVYSHKTNGILEPGTYTFGPDGKLIDESQIVKNGLVQDEDGEIRYYADGVAIYIGLVQDEDGNYYYINSSLTAVKNCTYQIYSHKTNGLLPAGEYRFGADGKMIQAGEEEPDAKNGLVRDDDGEIRYYVDGVATYIGLVQDEDGNYYYINSSLKAVKNCTYQIYSHKTNGLLPAGEYRFGADGKMIQAGEEEPDAKNGLVQDADGEIRYYVNGVATYIGLVQDEDGNYYYINSSLKAVKNCTYHIYAHMTNGLLPAGDYTFGTDGKMIR